MPDPALCLRGVSVSYDGVPAVVDTDLDVAEGEVLAVLGPSGCGKSTLLRAIAGLEPSGGSVTWRGTDVTRTPTHKRGFALMFQDGQLFPQLTVAGNVGYPLRLRRTTGSRQARPAEGVARPAEGTARSAEGAARPAQGAARPAQGAARPATGEDRAGRIAELLDLVGLTGLADRLPATLSGGERQRVALARALAASPRLLLLDEPLSALDAGLRGRLADDLRRILVESGTTTLMVTHDHEEAFTVADSLAVMARGEIVQTGPIGEVWRSPADPETALFLGYARVLEGEPAGRLLAAAGLPPAPAVGLRRSALAAADDGVIVAEVVSSRATPEQVRLVCLTDLGEVDAVAPLDRRPAPGDRIRLRVDPSRLAALSGARVGVRRL